MNSDNLEFFKSLKVKGVSFDRRQDVIAKMDSLDRIVLKRERSNEYDGNAIAIYTIRNEQIGYIDREVSTELAAIMDEGRKVAASISRINGGSGTFMVLYWTST
ncbi:HIRAN domain-containing protein [Neobacillus niacini]|uniref:HIRAN domain-containing protein n=1 Tax=Neobacillus niacini TaxID=86668 RepID=UPI00398320B0